MSILRGDDALAAWHWPNFHPIEFACKHVGLTTLCLERLVIDTEFMDALQRLRFAFNRPMPISSGYRCSEYNSHISTTGLRGPHTLGAVDVRVHSRPAYELVQHAMSLRFSGIGLQQRGSLSSRFVHLDNIPSSSVLHPRPRVWSY